MFGFNVDNSLEGGDDNRAKTPEKVSSRRGSADKKGSEKKSASKAKTISEILALLQESHAERDLHKHEREMERLAIKRPKIEQKAVELRLKN